MPVPSLWNKVLLSLKDEIAPQVFHTWIEPLRPRSLEDGHLVVEAPHSFLRDWIQENYLPVLLRTVRTLHGGELTLEIVVEDTGEAPMRPAVPEPPVPEAAPPRECPPAPAFDGGLNPRYTFQSFVVGASNQFAHAAAMAVAEQPASSYNPLFIYGGVGLGKTHLMHAIGHQILTLKPNARLCYLSSEKFMNDLINSLRFDRMPQFRERYRTMDVLLVDDIQFIAGKERTQEEFFHTFNTLFDSHKQIVISSDKYPREIPDLEERLRSRFEWGLVADIQAPDLETKTAILGKKAETMGVRIPGDVALFLAENTTSNIRELEGYLLRIVAFSSIRKTPLITMDLVREALKEFLEQKKRLITVDQIQKRVASLFAIKISDLKSKRKNKAFITPRHVAMYLCRQLTSHSLPEIGRQFGGRDHTTVLHAINKIEAQIRADAAFDQTVHALMKDIEEG